MSFKRTKVVMLPTNEKASTIWKTTNGQLIHTHVSGEYKEKYTPYHLYIITDDEIKEGDWWIDLLEKRIFKVTEEDVIVAKADGLPHNEFKKIIATTDTSLLFGGPKSKHLVYLPFPQPSEGFIQKFVDAYNSGKPIIEVDVEYEEYFEYDITNKKQSLKVNPKDYTITIKKVKDTYSKEEIKSLKDKLISLPKSEQMKILDTVETFDKWIEDNL